MGRPNLQTLLVSYTLKIINFLKMIKRKLYSNNDDLIFETNDLRGLMHCDDTLGDF